jgi:hypothetical protein
MKSIALVWLLTVIGTDWWYRAYVIFTGALVIVGAVGVRYAIKTLKAIERQALSMRRQTTHLRHSVVYARRSARAANKSATAALLNAQAVINAERPWVMVQVETIPGKNSAMSLFQLKLFNYGQTPAHIISCKGPKAEYFETPEKELPVPPDYGTWEWDRRFLAPKDSFPIQNPIDPWDTKLRFVTDRALQGIPSPQDQLVIYGIIEYTDGVSEQTYTTAYCYRRERSLLSQMGGHLVPCGPRAYNEYS